MNIVIKIKTRIVWKYQTKNKYQNHFIFEFPKTTIFFFYNFPKNLIILEMY